MCLGYCRFILNLHYTAPSSLPPSMRPATDASPTCCAPPVLIVMLQLVSPAAPTPAPPSGLLVKYTMPASRPRGVNRRYRQFALRDWPPTTPTRRSRPTSGPEESPSSAPLPAADRQVAQQG